MLSIIFVNYNSASLITDSISTLYQFNPGFEVEIVVADNGSSENDRQHLLSRFPSVTWIDMTCNAGFARANNRGMKAAEGDTLLLLNPDTLSIDDSIRRCYEQLNASSFSAAGVQLIDTDHQPQISGNYFMKGGLNHLLPIPYWGGLIRWLGYATRRKVPNVQQARAVEPVDWISGAFMMVKKNAVEKAGMMDEDFFLYAEEVEWCSRLGKVGPLCIYGDLHIIHLEGTSINEAHQISEKGYYNLYDKKGLQLMVSNHLRVRKQYGPGWFIFLLLNYTWGIFVFWIASTFHRLVTLRNPVGDWPRVFSFARNVGRLWMLAPTIISGKPHFYKMF